MRSIDADKLFDRVLEMLDNTEIDVIAVTKFMDLANIAPTLDPPPNDPLTLEVLRALSTFRTSMVNQQRYLRTKKFFTKPNKAAIINAG